MRHKLTYLSIIFCLLVLASIPVFVDFSHSTEDLPGTYMDVFFLDTLTNSIVSETQFFPILEEDPTTLYIGTDTMIENLISAIHNPTTAGYRSVLPDNVHVLASDIIYQTLTLHMSRSYNNLDLAEELIARSGLLHTFTGLDEINGINIVIDGNPIASSSSPISLLTADSILLNPTINRVEITTDQHDVTLYFVLPTLEGLYTQNYTLTISSDIDIEEQVINALLAVSRTSDHLLFLPPDIQILNVMIIDSVAYIDINSAFDAADAADERAQLLSIYAMVNTITALPYNNITEVQFLINSKSPTPTEGYIDFSQKFFRKDDLSLATTTEDSPAEIESHSTEPDTSQPQGDDPDAEF